MLLYNLTKQEWDHFLDSLPEYIRVVKIQDHAHPAKEVLLSPNETLFYFRKDVPKEKECVPDQKTILIGMHPCDAKTKKLLSFNFLSEPADPHFKAKMENTIMVSTACDHFDQACFCDQIGDSPASLHGTDAILFPLENGIHLLVNHAYLSDLLKQSGFASTEIENEKADFDKGNIAKRETEELPIQKLKEKGLSLIPQSELWEKISSTCLACGVCTFLCPACYCFDIQDIAYGRVGKRERTYDSCMFTQYTAEASGHNPRPSIKERWRQRLLHKFTYYPMQYNEIGCTGCGRCSNTCPSKIDIREVIRYAAEYCE